MQIFLTVFTVVEIVINVVGFIIIMSGAELEQNAIIHSLGKLTKNLFSNRNMFGKCLSFIVLILLLPAYLLALMMQIVLWCCVLLEFCWSLGTKKENQ